MFDNFIIVKGRIGLLSLGPFSSPPSDEKIGSCALSKFDHHPDLSSDLIGGTFTIECGRRLSLNVNKNRKHALLSSVTTVPVNTSMSQKIGV